MRAVTIGINHRYESTSSESSSESSDDESDASEYHEATEKLPESPAHHHQATSVSSSAVSVPAIPKSTETTNAHHSNAPLSLGGDSGLHSITQSPTLDATTCQHIIKSPASDSDKWHSAVHSSTTAMAPQETHIVSAESDSIQQYTTQNSAISPEHSSIESSTICMVLEQTVNQPQANSSDSQQNSNQLQSSGLTTQQPTPRSHTSGASHLDDSQSQTTDLTPYHQTVQLKASDAPDQQDTDKSPVSSPPENTDKGPKQESRCGTNSKFVIRINNKEFY